MLDIIELSVYFKRMKKSQVIYQTQMPSPRAFSRESVLIYDSILLKNSKIGAWIRKFPYSLPLKSGEKLKDLSSLHQQLDKLNQLSIPQTTDLTFIALGGGSVGDFVGFLASIYLRGRRLIHIPSTWLSAVDSSHGGKNGLNFQSEKNQLGTFYPADQIYVVSQLLQTQPQERLQEAMGEFLKMAIIRDKSTFSFLEKNVAHLNSNKIFSILPKTIHNKYQIVAKDPYEQNGHRRILNLGHTMGHVLESHYGWPHGLCVMLGMLFSIRWSYHLKIADEETYIRISNLIEDIWPEQTLSDDLASMPINTIRKKLSKDKKLTSNSTIDFIFIQKIGSVVRRKVKIQEILSEVHRQTKEY